MPGGSHYQSLVEVEEDTIGVRFGNEVKLRQAVVEALKNESRGTPEKKKYQERGKVKETAKCR